jgi:hypothetical protein
MNVVAAVANMQKELDYYKEIAAEMRGVIKQMAGQPPDGFEYIHPYDLSEIMNRTDVLDIEMNPSTKRSEFITIDNKKYKQSPHIPAKTKRFI